MLRLVWREKGNIGIGGCWTYNFNKLGTGLFGPVARAFQLAFAVLKEEEKLKVLRKSAEKVNSV